MNKNWGERYDKGWWNGFSLGIIIGVNLMTMAFGIALLLNG
jgi:hypothetical protein